MEKYIFAKFEDGFVCTYQAIWDGSDAFKNKLLTHGSPKFYMVRP